MKKLSVIAIGIIVIIGAIVLFREHSDGVKVGTLQKVSHKKFPCNYYEIQIAYDGGKMVTSGKHSAYENTQDVKIDKAAFDTLQKFVGEKVVFDYDDDGFAVCGSSKVLKSIKLK